MIIETDRLTIRPFRRDDLPEFEKLLDNSAGWQMQKDNAGGFLDWHVSNYERMDIVGGIVCFGIFDSESRDVLGAVGAGEHDDLHEPEVFISLLPGARGRGYGTEATEAITEWVFASYDIPCVIATTAVDNLPAQKVLASCGYVFEREMTLLVHVTNTKGVFRCYRRYAPSQAEPTSTIASTLHSTMSLKEMNQ